MLFAPKKHSLTPQQALAAKPLRSSSVELIQDAQGRAKLKLPLKPARWAGWFLRVPEGASKSFELDAIGLLVWNACDGKTSVQQIIRRLSKQYRLGLREAQAPTLAFLQTLARKGLIAMSVPLPARRQMASNAV